MLATHRPPAYRCIDCNRMLEGSPPTLYLCPSCDELSAQAQRDHQVREAAHDMLAALEGAERKMAEANLDVNAEYQAVVDAMAKARGKA